MNKDAIVMMRLTAEERKRWLAAAEAEDRTLSNWIRRQCNTAVRGDDGRRKSARGA